MQSTNDPPASRPRLSVKVSDASSAKNIKSEGMDADVDVARQSLAEGIEARLTPATKPKSWIERNKAKLLAIIAVVAAAGGALIGWWKKFGE
jgi:hypothetical protein